MFENLIEILKANPRKIVYTEGSDARILESAARLKKDGFLTPILVGNVDEVKAAAAKGGFDIEGLEIIDPLTYPEMDAMVEKMVELRRGKVTAEDARAALSKGNYFGTMLVKMGKADALLGGATYSTADTVRPALQLVKTKKGANLVSSCFILTRGDEMLCMGDCAINISYEDKLDKEGNVIELSSLGDDDDDMAPNLVSESDVGETVTDENEMKDSFTEEHPDDDDDFGGADDDDVFDDGIEDVDFSEESFDDDDE